MLQIVVAFLFYIYNIHYPHQSQSQYCRFRLLEKKKKTIYIFEKIKEFIS